MLIDNDCLADSCLEKFVLFQRKNIIKLVQETIYVNRRKEMVKGYLLKDCSFMSPIG
jgi:hypothetical protein